jgi:hypothetical protein
MSANIMTAGKRPTAIGALFAAVLLVFAAVVAPICALMVACATPCCEGSSLPSMLSVAASGCAEHCGISSDTSSDVRFPDAVAPSTETANVSLASLTVAEEVRSLAWTPPSRVAAFSFEPQHAVPGDAPVYLYNSAFLI